MNLKAKDSLGLQIH